ncbi:unnamed protein product [Prorocentrum cordatum]|uniref:Uncharacterized protein n=1 Tax=Prorocentrum cordatum TaxID=2364126 RepID=A0ABN9W2W4_9DINO|nr:unnamed protein product [Polarella glacialis]
MDAAPTSAEGKDQEMQQSILDRVDPTNASALSELGEPELSRVSAFRATRPERKERRRRRHFRRAPRASRRKRAKIEREMAEWLPGAVETERAAEETFESVDNELLGQLLNFTSEANETPSLDRAERELKTIQEIWDRYELDNENVTAMDIGEALPKQRHLVRRRSSPSSRHERDRISRGRCQAARGGGEAEGGA